MSILTDTMRYRLLASSPQTAMDPERVTIDDLFAAARAAKGFDRNYVLNFEGLGTERSGGRSRMYLVVPLPLEVEAM